MKMRSAPATLDVLIPHFDEPDGLAQSLNSIVKQTWQGDVRVVICDDGSDEIHAERARQIAAEKHGDRFTVEFHRNDTNLGRPATRNRLLALSQSKYLSWLDAGDVWYPLKLESQFDELYRLEWIGEDTRGIWVTCHYDWQWDDEAAKVRYQNTDQDQLKAILIGSTLRAYLWTLLGRREAFEFVGCFDTQLPRLQDLDFFLRFLRGGGRLVVPRQKQPLCCYYKTDVGRDAAVVSACHQIIHDKHCSALYPYGAVFVQNRHYSANVLAARFAQNNRQSQKWLYLAKAAYHRPTRAIRMLASNLGNL